MLKKKKLEKIIGPIEVAPELAVPEIPDRQYEKTQLWVATMRNSQSPVVHCQIECQSSALLRKVDEIHWLLLCKDARNQKVDDEGEWVEFDGLLLKKR